MRKKYGQAAMEYMFIFGFSLVILGILWSYSSSNVSDTRWELQAAYAKSAMSKITQTAELAYIQGPPAQFYIQPVFPDNVQKVYISSNLLTLELRWKESILRNISVDTSASLNITNSSISTAPGTHKVRVQALNGSVSISDV